MSGEPNRVAVASTEETGNRPEQTDVIAHSPPPENSPERPTWLPEKFKSPEDLAKAYGDLESKLGAQAPAAAEPEATKAQGKPEIQEVPKGISQEALEPFHQEWAEKGELSEDSFKQLEQMGLPRGVVDSYIAGVQAQTAQAEAAIFAEVGGQEQFNAMAQWAGANLPTERINTLNGMLKSGGEQAKLAAGMMKAAYVEANGSPPKLLSGGPNAVGEVYQSYAQLMKDMNNPQYENDPAFRAQVAQKMARSGELQ